MISHKNVITIDPAIYRERFKALSHEAKGFWLDLMAAGCGSAAAIPACEEKLGHMIGCDVRKVRRLRDELVAAGILEARFGVKGAA